MLNGLDLFSGIGGLSIALSEWVRPIAYCEIDPYCQGELLSKMVCGLLPKAPIWDDVRSLSITSPDNSIDILYGGFPCQDISIAGRGKGLEGERSGLFFEIIRLSKEIKPKFIFLENVPAITSRGGLRVVREITEMGCDCRWCIISAASVGAYHKRERWFCLAKHSYGERINCGEEQEVFNSQQIANSERISKNASNSSSLRCNEGACEGIRSQRETIEHEKLSDYSGPILNYWENTEPPVCGVAHGIPHRVDRIRALGNAVVPQQAKKAFKILMGIK